MDEKINEKKFLNVDGLIRLVANIIDSFAPKVHGHNISEITDYVVDNELSSSSSNPVENKTIKSKFDEIDADMSNILFKTPQDLTLEEVNQVRINIHSVGQHTAGLTYTPYDVVEEGLNTDNHTVEEVPLSPIEAAEGAEIFNDYDGNIATGLYSFATGYRTQATGNYACSHGWWTKSTGQCASAEGLLSVANGHFSHAEGTRTKATANNAHSEGDLTVASGRQSHAEGSESVASGFCAHAEGSKTLASGYFAHTEGLGTIAAGRNQSAIGKYNVSDTSSLFIVGNGTSDTKRSNAFKLDASGNALFAGDVVANGSGENVSLKNINTILGSEALSTEAKTIIGAINELYTLYSSIVQMTADDVDSLMNIDALTS